MNNNVEPSITNISEIKKPLNLKKNPFKIITNVAGKGVKK